MTATANPYRQYKANEINNADQGKLIIMLYDGAIKFINKALELIGESDKIQNENIEDIHKNLVKTQNIIAELMGSLNMEVGDISQRLLSIYMYMNTRLIEANLKKDKKPLVEVRDHLKELREAWLQASKIVAKDEAGKAVRGGVNIAT